MKIDFEFATKHGVFKYALHLLNDPAFSNANIEAIKQQQLGIIASPATPQVTYTLQPGNFYPGSDNA